MRVVINIYANSNATSANYISAGLDDIQLSHAEVQTLVNLCAR